MANTPHKKHYSNKHKPLIERTLEKMQRSQRKKAEIVGYLKEHKPHLLWSMWKEWRIRSCANVLRFKAFANGEQYLAKAMFCKYDKFCIACATRRAIKQLQLFTASIQKYWLEDYHWYHITPTIRHNKWQSLEQVMDNLQYATDSMARAYKNGKRSQQKTKSFFCQFDGMISSMEITHWKNGRHPHLHIIACSKKQIPIKYSNFMWTESNRQLQEEWYYQHSQQMWKNIGIKEIGVHTDHFNRKWVGEIFKYAVKFSKLEVPELAEVIELQSKKRYRFLKKYGVCRKWKHEKSTKKYDWSSDIGDVFVFQSGKYGIL